VVLEGLEVAFIVVSFGASANQLGTAVIGGVAAVVWVVPLVAAAAAAVGLVVVFRRRRLRAGPASAVSEEDRALVEQALG